MFVSPLFAMSGDGVDDIRIPMVFLFMEEAKKLLEVQRILHSSITNFLCVVPEVRI